MKRLRRALADEGGSTIPLAVGYLLVAVALVIVCVDATSLYLAQKRLDATADAAALAAADGFTLRREVGGPVATLTADRIRAQVDAFLADAPGETRLVSAGTPDGVSARVTVAGTWSPPLVSFLVPAGVDLSATATSRTALH